MKGKKIQSFLLAGSVLTALLIIEELFLIVCAVLTIFFYEPKINRILTCVLVCAPFIITFIYSLLSFFEKSKDRSKTFIAGITALIIPVVGMLVFFPILNYVSALIAFAGILLSVHGLVKAKITVTYGIICINAAYFTLLIGTYILIFAHSGYAPSGLDILEIILSAIFIAVICTFIIADLVCTTQSKKFNTSPI